MATIKQTGNHYSLTDLNKDEIDLIEVTMMAFSLGPFIEKLIPSKKDIQVAKKLYKDLEPLKDQIRIRKRAAAEERIS